MKLTRLLLVACGLLFIASCSNEPEASSAAEQLPEKTSTGEVQTSTTVSPENSLSITPPEAMNSTSTAAAPEVPHYICPNSCAGGGGAAAGPCPVCGTEMTHNQAYHNQPGAPQAQEAPVPPPPSGTGPNASGEWHYTCPSGCEGGGDVAGPCAKCGAELAHNAAFHN